MTNQQGAPEALRLAELHRQWADVMPCGANVRYEYLNTEVELRRLHAENERLAALVEAQQSAACDKAPAGWLCIRQHGHDGPCAAEPTLSARSDEWVEGYAAGVRDGRADALRAPQPSPTPQANSAQGEPLQAFDSPRAKALMRAWEEGWAACRDAEYVGEEAQNDAFNSSHTLTLCIAEDQQLPTPQADPLRPVVDLQEQAGMYADDFAPQADSQPAPTHAQIAAYLKATGAYVTNDATREAAIAEAVNADRAARAPADSVLEDADPLQGAANWLAEAHGQFGVAVLQGCLMIGYNRAKRLHDAAIDAARKQGGAT